VAVKELLESGSDTLFCTHSQCKKTVAGEIRSKSVRVRQSPALPEEKRVSERVKN
jgi:hypothetical protein